MRKLLVIITILCAAYANAQEVSFNEEQSLELKEVVKADGMTKEQIFAAVQSMLSEWHPDENSNAVIDYSDIDAGTIFAKGKMCLGFTKYYIIGGYFLLADYSCAVMIKDGRYQVDIKVPSVMLHWSGNDTFDETIPVSYVYPKYKKFKARYRNTKRPLVAHGQKVADIMRAFFNAIKEKVGKPVDDF